MRWRNFLYRLAGQCLAREHHLQAVVIRRIVAAGDHHRAIGLELEGGEIGHRCGDHADIDDVDAALLYAACQGLCELGAGQAAITSDGDAVLFACGRFRADGMSDGFHDLGSQCLADDAAYVIGLEDFFGEHG